MMWYSVSYLTSARKRRSFKVKSDSSREAFNSARRVLYAGNIILTVKRSGVKLKVRRRNRNHFGWGSGGSFSRTSARR
jgi:hypothetical protein